MKVHHSIEKFRPNDPVVLTQGTFDGIHIGHQHILKHLVAQAKKLGGESVLLTFYPHPRLVLYPNDNELKLLTDLEEKINLVSELGLDHLIVLPFTKELSRLSPEQFVDTVLIDQLKVSKVIVGYDHRFGRNREGSFIDMERFARAKKFELQEIPAHDVDECIVSSTKIRQALLGGDIEEANLLLGRKYSLNGEVVHGNKRGKDLGYPTINLHISSEYKLIPNNGVYAAHAMIEGHTYGAMLNIGDNPTFDDKNWSIEAHIFEFNKNVYNQKVEIAFVKKMRDEMKFNSVDELKSQMTKDEVLAKRIIENTL
ncbi:MAG: bifunctional riboflavin kinase/FAD synthetase [Bacteroidia bacterium]